LPRLDAKVEETAFAILQEAITNARKHSKGAPIHVRLIQGEALIIAQVEDEGPGFDLQAVMSSYTSKSSLGLLNMQERAGLVGGQLKIDTVGVSALLFQPTPATKRRAIIPAKIDVARISIRFRSPRMCAYSCSRVRPNLTGASRTCSSVWRGASSVVNVFGRDAR
jgi:hypothetical protein